MTLNIISLGAGVQSSVMALMAAHGEIEPMPDCAIFADTWEPAAVYTHLNWLETQLPFPVHRITNGSIEGDLKKMAKGKKIGGVYHPPFFAGKGMLFRNCTNHYKIVPITNLLRKLAGVKKGKPPKKILVNQSLGISTDEASRMKPSRHSWVNHVFPLIDKGMSRVDCLRWFGKNYGDRKLTKSACIICPYRDDKGWRDMKINSPEEFKQAVRLDKDIRNATPSADPVFIHRSLRPLDQVDFRNLEDMGQLNMFNNECEGMCGV